MLKIITNLSISLLLSMIASQSEASLTGHQFHSNATELKDKEISASYSDLELMFSESDSYNDDKPASGYFSRYNKNNSLFSKENTIYSHRVLHDFFGWPLNSREEHNQPSHAFRFHESKREHGGTMSRHDEHEIKFPHEEHEELEKNELHPSSVPIPSSALLLSSGLLGLMALTFKRKNAL